MTDLSVNLFGESLDNPVIPASGCFGFGREFAEFYDLRILGSISLKGSTLRKRYGNPLPRIAECPVGMLNSVGLQNPSVAAVIENELPNLRRIFGKKIIMNVGGETADDYAEAVRLCNGIDDVLAVELNISCPNVQGGGMVFGTDSKVAGDLVKRVRAVSDRKLLVKLSPNVTDIVSVAKAVEDAGADGVSLINTLVGMRIDLRTKKPILAVKKGGYSGAGVFPVAVRMVYDVAKAVKIPVVGMGGIRSAENVLEMMLAGATAVMVGTENLINPYACRDIVEALPQVMGKYNVKRLTDIIGRA